MNPSTGNGSTGNPTADAPNDSLGLGLGLEHGIGPDHGNGGDHGLDKEFATGARDSDATPADRGHMAPAIDPAPAADPQQGSAPSGPSFATIIWGLFLVAVAGVIGADALSGWAFDPVLTTAVVALVAGVLLLLSAALGALRQGRHR